MTPSVVALLLAPALAPARPEMPPTKPTAEPRTVAELVNAVRWYRLPLPPRNVPFVKWVTTSEEGDKSGVVRKVPESNFGFVLFPQIGPQSASILIGDWTYEFDENVQESWSRVRPVTPTPALLDEPFRLRGELLLLAAQFAAAGYGEMAVATFDRAKRESKQEGVLAQFRYMAWHHTNSRLIEPGTDRAELLKTLKDVAADDKRFQQPHHSDLITSLELALKPRTSRPGTVEFLIDDLTEYHEPYPGFRWDEENRVFRNLAGRGFDAVPALITHLTDRRPTRSRFQGFNNFRSYTYRVSHVVSDLLDELAAGQIPEVGAGRLQGWALDPEAARRWWGTVKTVGEEKWALDHVLPTGPDEGHPNNALLVMIRAKYPRRLPEVYRTLLRTRPHVYSHRVADELVAADLPGTDKIAVLIEAASHDLYRHRHTALFALREIDRGEFRKALRATLTWLPPDVSGEDYWMAPEPHLTVHAIRANEPQCWAALTAATKRAAVGFRIELLGKAFGKYEPSPWIARAPRLSYLEAFLDDTSIRDAQDNGKYSGHHAGYEYPRIAIRDFAALKLTEALKIDVPVKPDRTPPEWAAVRDRVKAALAAERAKP